MINYSTNKCAPPEQTREQTHSSLISLKNTHAQWGDTFMDKCTSWTATDGQRSKTDTRQFPARQWGTGFENDRHQQNCCFRGNRGWHPKTQHTISDKMTDRDQFSLEKMTDIRWCPKTHDIQKMIKWQTEMRDDSIFPWDNEEELGFVESGWCPKTHMNTSWWSLKCRAGLTPPKTWQAKLTVNGPPKTIQQLNSMLQRGKNTWRTKTQQWAETQWWLRQGIPWKERGQEKTHSKWWER